MGDDPDLLQAILRLSETAAAMARTMRAGKVILDRPADYNDEE
jgi:hypothetical protein